MAKKGKRKLASGDVASNRRAAHRYEFVEKFEAGMQLHGTEVKSLRGGKAMLADAYAVVDDGEVWLRNMHIPPYPPAAQENHEPDRPRKLLLHAHEIERLVGRHRPEGTDARARSRLFQGPAGEGRTGAGAG